jgi:predicted  nucleic acid-binding Zn-ribbon protein
MNSFNFNSKETYFQARAEWKANYARLTTEAREVRREFNDAQRTFSKIPAYNYRAYSPAEKEANALNAAADKAVYTLRRNREEIRQEANAALEELVEMKAEANRQWLASQLIPA